MVYSEQPLIVRIDEVLRRSHANVVQVRRQQQMRQVVAGRFGHRLRREEIGNSSATRQECWSSWSV